MFCFVLCCIVYINVYFILLYSLIYSYCLKRIDNSFFSFYYSDLVRNCCNEIYLKCFIVAILGWVDCGSLASAFFLTFERKVTLVEFHLSVFEFCFVLRCFVLINVYFILFVNLTVTIWNALKGLLFSFYYGDLVRNFQLL